MNRLRAATPVVLIVLAPMAMLHTLWINPTSAGEDDVIYYYPMRKLVGAAMRGGRWPLANPYEATGTCLIADPQSAVLYPPTWLFAVMAPGSAYALTLMVGGAMLG